MAASHSNTDVIVENQPGEAPCCPHGPALLFERYTKSKETRKFYACSAFRDRKMCRFFRWADDAAGRKKGDDPHSTDPIDVGLGHPLTHSEYRKRYQQFKKQPVSQRSLCSPCGLLLLTEEVKEHEGKGHLIKGGITKAALQRPTSLFEPQEDNKTYAQYLFTDPVVQFIVDRLEKLNNKTHILCLGTPRLHEAVSTMGREGQTKMTSLLMDLDCRYAQVLSEKTFCRYNMFNHHFFDAGGADRFKSFVREGGAGLVLVTDPPFGGMVEALGATFTKIEDTWRTEAQTDSRLPMVWFFPYFMEKRVLECSPALTMLDYKDGTTYRHCESCQRCVKSTRVHCDTCGLCELPEHRCGQPKGEGCHICGALDHKRRDCPQRHNPSPSSRQHTMRESLMGDEENLATRKFLKFTPFTAESYQQLLLWEALEKRKEQERKERSQEAHLKDGELKFGLDDAEDKVIERNPDLEEGKALKREYGEPPAYYMGLPLEEVDKGVTAKTFIVLSRWLNHVQISRFSAAPAFFILPATSPVRRLAVLLSTNQIVDFFILFTILSNCICLAIPETNELSWLE
ncbi:hypothetical protein ACOMHN_021498 [Nucella lapillus]